MKLDGTLLRPPDIRYGATDPSRAARLLGWQAKRQVDAVIDAMCRAAEADVRNAAASHR